MKTIPLTMGYIAFVDDDDFEYLNRFKWCVNKNNGRFYAYRRIDKHHMKYMHRSIMNARDGDVVDHADGNGLNNSRANLRLTNQSKNMANSNKSHSNNSGFKGVTCSSLEKRKKPWRAQICVNYQTIFLGRYKNKEEAAEEYDRAAKKFFGEYAKINKSMYKPDNSKVGGAG